MSRRVVRVPEKAVQHQCVTLLRTVGAKVYVLGTRRKRGDHPGTMQTPGIADLKAYLPRPPGAVGWNFRLRRGLWQECKVQGGRLSPEQREFRELCQHAGEDYVVGGLVELTAYLVSGGWLKGDNVPHYRRPTTPCTETCLTEIDLACSVVARCSGHGRTHKEATASRVQEATR